MSSQPLSKSSVPDESIAYKVITSLSVTFGLAVITLCMRLYSRITVAKKVGWDDWSIILATVKKSSCVRFALMLTLYSVPVSST